MFSILSKLSVDALELVIASTSSSTMLRVSRSGDAHGLPGEDVRPSAPLSSPHHNPTALLEVRSSAITASLTTTTTAVPKSAQRACWLH
jgi:hypothetical protein